MDTPIVLITGGGRGIGRAIALRFAREGAIVCVAARTGAEIDLVAKEVGGVGGTGVAVEMDVTDPLSVRNALDAVLQRTNGRLDVLVNNAGVFDVIPFEDLTEEAWRRQIAVNLNGPFFVTRAALEALERSTGAHVFNISSVAGRQPFDGCTAYCTTKYGLRGFGDALREELTPRGMRVSTVYPGATDTTIFDGVPGDWDRSTMNRPEDVAEVVWRAYSSPRDEDVRNLDVPPPRGGAHGI